MTINLDRNGTGCSLSEILWVGDGGGDDGCSCLSFGMVMFSVDCRPSSRLVDVVRP